MKRHHLYTEMMMSNNKVKILKIVSSPPHPSAQSPKVWVKTLFSNTNSSELDEKKRIHVVQMDSTSKRNTEPVHRSPMFTEKNKHKTAGPSGILTNGHLEKEKNDKQTKPEGPHRRQNRNQNQTGMGKGHV